MGEIEGIGTIKEFISGKFGLDFSGDRELFLRTRCADRMNALGISDFQEYLFVIEKHPDELSRFVESILIKETYFFREPQAFSALSRIASKTKGRFNILSIGCSTGDEVWSCIMKLIDGGFSNFFVWGFDLSKEAIRKSREAVYSKSSLIYLPEGFEDKFFSTSDHELFKVKDELRKYVYFFVANAYDPEVFRKLLSFDVILMRNVIMYFTEEARGKIVSMVYDKLASGGYLLVSSSENLLDIYPLFIPEFLSASSSYICWRKP